MKGKTSQNKTKQKRHGSALHPDPTRPENRSAVPRKCRRVSMATGAAKLVVVEEAEKAGWVYFGTDLDSRPPHPLPRQTPTPWRAGWLTAHWCSAAWRRWRAGALEAGSTSGARYNAWSVYLAGAQVAPMSFLRLRRGGRTKKNVALREEAGQGI